MKLNGLSSRKKLENLRNLREKIGRSQRKLKKIHTFDRKNTESKQKKAELV